MAMEFLWHRHRDNPVEEMVRDPEFLFRVGRLIGATEMVGYMLAGGADPENKRLGMILLERLSWFPVEPGTEKIVDPFADTVVREKKPWPPAGSGG
jgi:hypothetical protein